MSGVNLYNSNFQMHYNNFQACSELSCAIRFSYNVIFEKFNTYCNKGVVDNFRRLNVKLIDPNSLQVRTDGPDNFVILSIGRSAEKILKKLNDYIVVYYNQIQICNNFIGGISSLPEVEQSIFSIYMQNVINLKNICLVKQSEMLSLQDKLVKYLELKCEVEKLIEEEKQIKRLQQLKEKEQMAADQLLALSQCKSESPKRGRYVAITDGNIVKVRRI